MTRVKHLALGAFLWLGVPAFAVVAAPLAGLNLAYAGEHAIAVGTELEATTDVQLHQAEIAKGSRVSVTKVSKSGDKVDAVNVALADGHVVKVTMAQVHTYFQVVGD